jgi:hypothetical protein
MVQMAPRVTLCGTSRDNIRDSRDATQDGAPDSIRDTRDARDGIEETSGTEEETDDAAQGSTDGTEAAGDVVK